MKTSNKKKSFKRSTVPLTQKIAKLKSLEVSTVTFVMEDGSKTIQNISNEFVQGKTVSAIINDLKAIQHDLNAKYFTL